MDARTGMKANVVKIEATIRPHRLEAVQEALYDLGIRGMTVMEVRGSGRSKGISHTFRGSQYSQNLAPRLKLEVVLEESESEAAVNAIQDAAQTGEVGDGMIFVLPVGEAIRIRTNERGTTALD
ncbi:P-II family nitrogen regulator [soil metagenome]